MKLGVAILVCMAVAGCGIARQKEEKAAWAQAKAEGDKCAATYRKFTMNWAACTNEVQERLVSRVGAPSDYSRFLMASRVALSEKVSTGKMTYAEADLAFAQMNMNALSTVSARESAAETASAARQAARAASRPVTCNRFGTTVTCF